MKDALFDVVESREGPDTNTNVHALYRSIYTSIRDAEKNALAGMYGTDTSTVNICIKSQRWGEWQGFPALSVPGPCDVPAEREGGESGESGAPGGAGGGGEAKVHYFIPFPFEQKLRLSIPGEYHGTVGVAPKPGAKPTLLPIVPRTPGGLSAEWPAYTHSLAVGTLTILMITLGTQTKISMNFTNQVRRGRSSSPSSNGPRTRSFKSTWPTPRPRGPERPSLT